MSGSDDRRARRRLTVLVPLGCAATVCVVWSIGTLASHAQSRDFTRERAVSASSEAAPTTEATADADPRVVGSLPDPGWVANVAERTGIPDRALLAYAGADLRVRADSGCEVGWNTLAAIGFVETEHGTLGGGAIREDGRAIPRTVGIPLDGTTTDAIPDSDGGVIDGDDQWDRAVGPLQFIPQTWAEWGSDGNGDGTADIDHIDDAALAAARYLCAARGTLADGDAWVAAVRSYNDSAEYQQRVADAAVQYARAAQ